MGDRRKRRTGNINILYIETLKTRFELLFLLKDKNIHNFLQTLTTDRQTDSIYFREIYDPEKI